MSASLGIIGAAYATVVSYSIVVLFSDLLQRFVGRGRDRYLMASPEKAICDELYRVAGIRSIQRMQDLLFEDLRLDRERFMELDRQDLLSLSGRYSATTLDTFARFVRRQSYSGPQHPPRNPDTPHPASGCPQSP